MIVHGSVHLSPHLSTWVPQLSELGPIYLHQDILHQMQVASNSGATEECLRWKRKWPHSINLWVSPHAHTKKARLQELNIIGWSLELAFVTKCPSLSFPTPWLWRIIGILWCAIGVILAEITEKGLKLVYGRKNYAETNKNKHSQVD